MFNKFLILSLLFVGCLYSCNNRVTSSNDNPTINVTKDSLIISTASDNQLELTIYALDDIVVSNQIDTPTSFSLLDLAKQCKDKKDVALKAVNNNNTIPFRVKIGEIIDTLVNYTIEPYYDEAPIFSISGQCAPLVSKLSNPSQSIDLKKWLFRKKAHLGEEQLNIFIGLFNQLSRSKTVEYVTNSTMPVLHSFAGIKYNVQSNLEGNYFVLFAGKSMKDIDAFVEEVVANDFELCSKSVSSEMNCYRKADSNGYMCISLIAIKKDWSYQIQPLGLVAIDNIAPGEGRNDNITAFNFANNVKVYLPSNKPDIYGDCNVVCASEGGNGIECNISFHISHVGDVKSVTVKRTKKLCYDSWTHKVENKVILVKNVSNPYSFTMMMHLEDGDNYIPIIVEDNHGNKKEFELNERASFTRSSAPSVNIDNNVNIYD